MSVTSKHFSFPATIWFELPYRVFLELREKRVFLSKNEEAIPATLEIRNDIVMAFHYDYYDSKQAWDKYVSDLRSGKKREHIIRDAPMFLTTDRFEALKTKQKNGARLHGIRNRTFVTLKTLVTESSMPSRELIQKFFFDWLNEIISTYRISALPYHRYSVDTISEANLKVCYVKRGSGTLMWWFSARDHGELSHPHGFEEYGVKARFKKLRGKLSDSEVTYSLAFPLFHQRRYREALLVAYSSCETLLKELVHTLSRKEELASILWKTHRNRTDDIFKVVLPALGADNISEKNPELWKRFLKARDSRNLSGHDSSDLGVTDEEVRGYLETFYELSCWLIGQSKLRIKKWNLSPVHTKTGEAVPKQFSF